MLAKAIYLGYHPLGGDLKIDGVKIMQLKWKYLHRPIILPFGNPIQGAIPSFSDTFVVKENGKTVFFLAKESGIGKYHIWSFSDKAVEKLRKCKRIKTEK